MWRLSHGLVAYQPLHVHLFGVKRKMVRVNLPQFIYVNRGSERKNWNNLSTRNGRNQILLFAHTADGPFHTELVGSLKIKNGNELAVIFHSLCILFRRWVSLIMHRITMKLSCEALLLLSLPALCTTRVWLSPIELYRVPIMHFYHDKCESIPNEWRRFKSSEKQSSKHHDQDAHINCMKEWTSATNRMRAIALILSETHELGCST